MYFSLNMRFLQLSCQNAVGGGGTTLRCPHPPQPLPMGVGGGVGTCHSLSVTSVWLLGGYYHKGGKSEMKMANFIYVLFFLHLIDSFEPKL